MFRRLFMVLGLAALMVGKCDGMTRDLSANLGKLKGSLTDLKAKLNTLNTKMAQLKGKLGTGPVVGGTTGSGDISGSGKEPLTFESLDVKNVTGVPVTGHNKKEKLLVLLIGNIKQPEHVDWDSYDSIHLKKITFDNYYSYRLQGLVNLKKCVIEDPIDLVGINFVNNENLEEISISGADERFGFNYTHAMPPLSGLSFEKCPNLKRIIMNNCPGLKTYRAMAAWAPDLEVIDLQRCDNLESFQIQEFKTIKNVNLKGCKKLREVKIWAVKNCEVVLDKDCEGKVNIESSFSQIDIKYE